MSEFSDASRIALPEELAARYEVVSCLKYSEQSSTCILRDSSSGRPYLLKTASDLVYGKLLKNEKEILEYIHSIEHSWLTDTFPSPVRLVTQGDTFFYVRTYIEGKTLEELVESNYKKPGLPAMRSLDYVIALTELLHFLHTLQPPLIHRDIKPQNVVVDAEGVCHFIDLGISRFYQPEKSSDTFIMGTKLTAPPEQFGYQQTDIRSDLYSLGILLFYCITGEYEVKEDSLTELPEELARIIRKATMFDPGKRYQTTDELLPDLIGARFSGQNERTGRKHRSHARAAYAACAVLLVLNLGLAGMLLAQRHAGTGGTGLSANDTPQTDSRSAQNDMLSSANAVPETASRNTQNITAVSEDKTTDADFLNTQSNLTSTRNSTPDTTVPDTASSAPDDPDAVYTFAEPMIEEAVRSQLGIPEAPLTNRDLAKVSALHIYGLQIYRDDSEVWFRGDEPWFYDEQMRESGLYEQTGPISSLEDIAHLPNLRTLCLYNQQLEDISALQDTAVTTLGLGYNPLTDLTPLAGNVSIRSLNLSCLDITDLSVVATLPSLTTLNIGGTLIHSLDGIQDCDITDLNICSLPIDDYSVLQQLPNLKTLLLNSLSSEMLDAIAGLPIEKLTFLYSENLPLDSLAVLPQLRDLYFRGNHYETLQAEAPALDKLEKIDLVDMTIEDFTALSSLTSLSKLYIYSADCKSYEGLDRLPKLQTICCTQKQHDAIAAMYPDSEYIYLY